MIEDRFTERGLWILKGPMILMVLCSTRRDAPGGQELHPGAFCGESLELDARGKFEHPACIGTLSITKGRALNIGASAVERDRLQLSYVEDVIRIHLHAKQRVIVEAIKCNLLGEAHVCVEVTRPSEAVATDSRHIEWSVYAGWGRGVEVSWTTLGKVRSCLESTVGAA